MRINVLPEEIKNQIISGEIIEGPAECVKELMENSLDAKATKVDVEIVKGGKRFIGVRDNFGGWFQMGETGLYSINLYIKDEKGRTWKVNFDYMLQ